MADKSVVAEIEASAAHTPITTLTLNIFSSTEGNRSIERYAGELGESSSPLAKTNLIAPPVRSGFFKKAANKLNYLRTARKLKNDASVIVSVKYAFLLLALAGERTICVCHDLHPLMFPGRNFRERLLFRLNLRLLSRARAVVAVSEHTRTQLLQYCSFLDPERIITIHNGLHRRWRKVSNQSTLNEFRQRHDLQDRRFILHVGNDNWYKNFSSLLQAFASLEERDLRLVKVGKISDQEQRLIRELKIEERLITFSELTDDDLVLLYNCAEVLVFPSLQEGFGWPPLEAMACGCPVIAGNRPSLPEICGDGAVYVNPERPSEIASAIARLRLQPQLRERLVRAGIGQAAKYDWNKTVHSILVLFNS